jgi:hypothetical protein
MVIAATPATDSLGLGASKSAAIESTKAIPWRS